MARNKELTPEQLKALQEMRDNLTALMGSVNELLGEEPAAEAEGEGGDVVTDSRGRRMSRKERDGRTIMGLWLR